MCLGALVSAGVPLAYLEEQLAQLNLPEVVKLTVSTVRKNGIAATKVNVGLPHETDATTLHPPVRHLSDIEQIITAAALPNRAIAWSLAIFKRLAIAEGAIHGIGPQQVHFHEVGATDAIVDILGTCLGLDWLGIDELYCAPLPTGRGTVRAAHGQLPVPAPAVLKLMEMAQVPIYNAGLQGELVTPTGAAIVTELATHFGEPPMMQLQTVGLGAGNKELPLPNILRLWIGQTAETPAASFHRHSHAATVPPSAPPNPESSPATVSSQPPISTSATAPTLSPISQSTLAVGSNDSTPATLQPRDEIEHRAGLETVVVLETQVDDLSPQAIGYLYDRLLEAGALDVFTQSVMMKKSRPGHLITVIAYPEQAHTCETILLHETTTLGVRQIEHIRHRLRREIVTVETSLGPIRMKLAFTPGQAHPLKAHPEYADCARLAQEHQWSWRDVHDQAIAAWRTQGASRSPHRFSVNPQE